MRGSGIVGYNVQGAVEAKQLSFRRSVARFRFSTRWFQFVSAGDQALKATCCILCAQGSVFACRLNPYATQDVEGADDAVPFHEGAGGWLGYQGQIAPVLTRHQQTLRWAGSLQAMVGQAAINIAVGKATVPSLPDLTPGISFEPLPHSEEAFDYAFAVKRLAIGPTLLPIEAGTRNSRRAFTSRDCERSRSSRSCTATCLSEPSRSQHTQITSCSTTSTFYRTASAVGLERAS